jgi:acetylornithine deacetylase/succinyl-diaminopimelate desuccinylase-like protein
VAGGVTREELLGRLVACDSRSQVSDREIADVICDYVDRPEVRIVRHPSPGGTKLNVIAIRGPRRDDGAGLVLSSHMDTVPFGEPEWESDPEVTERVRRPVEDAVGTGDVLLDLISESPAMATPGAAPIHHAVCALTGQRESRAVSFTTDGGWLAGLGLDCIAWGPGSIQTAHKPNEWLGVEEFERGAELLESLVADLCVRPAAVTR